MQRLIKQIPELEDCSEELHKALVLVMGKLPIRVMETPEGQMIDPASLVDCIANQQKLLISLTMKVELLMGLLSQSDALQVEGIKSRVSETTSEIVEEHNSRQSSIQVPKQSSLVIPK